MQFFQNDNEKNVHSCIGALEKEPTMWFALVLLLCASRSHVFFGKCKCNLNFAMNGFDHFWPLFRTDGCQFFLLVKRQNTNQAAPEWDFRRMDPTVFKTKEFRDEAVKPPIIVLQGRVLMHFIMYVRQRVNP